MSDYRAGCMSESLGGLHSSGPGVEANSYATKTWSKESSTFVTSISRRRKGDAELQQRRELAFRICSLALLDFNNGICVASGESLNLLAGRGQMAIWLRQSLQENPQGVDL